MPGNKHLNLGHDTGLRPFLGMAASLILAALLLTSCGSGRLRTAPSSANPAAAASAPTVDKGQTKPGTLSPSPATLVVGEGAASFQTDETGDRLEQDIQQILSDDEDDQDFSDLDRALSTE